jgi:hypothetical protein
MIHKQIGVNPNEGMKRLPQRDKRSDIGLYPGTWGH